MGPEFEDLPKKTDANSRKIGRALHTDILIAGYVGVADVTREYRAV